MQNSFISKGTLRYSPKLLGDRVSEKWWLILDCDAEIGRYFRTLHYMAVYGCEKLSRPAWAEHITVIRDEEPPNKTFWEKYNGHTAEFTIINEVETDGEYYWLPVLSDGLLDLREELGLTRQPLYPLHLSIGHRDGRGGRSVANSSCNR